MEVSTLDFLYTLLVSKRFVKFQETINKNNFLGVLESFGGWPVLVGKSWNQSNFHTIKVPYPSFVNLDTKVTISSTWVSRWIRRILKDIFYK